MHTAFDDVSLAPMIAPTVGAAPELERLGDEIAELSAHLDAATARLLDLIREFDARGGWGNGSGFRSCAHWLTWRVGLNPGAARERVRVARALGTLPRLAEALARGELSYSKVRALTRVATPETEERLLRVGRAGTAEHVERIVRGWRRVDRKAEAQEASQRHRNRALHVYHDEDGMVIIRARLEPEAGAVVVQALAAAREALHQRARGTDAVGGSAGPGFTDGPAGPRYVDGSPEAPTIEQQEADALALVAETALHRGIDPGTPGERYQVVVHVDAAVLADADAPGQSVLEGGTHVPAGTSQRLACDATRVVMRHDADGRITSRRPASVREPGAAPSSCRSGRDATRAERRQRHSYRRADIEARLARRTPEPRLRDRRVTPTGHGRDRTCLRQSRDRHEPAAVALAVGVQQLGMAGRAQAWILDARRIDPRLRQQLLVRRPQIEPHAAVRRRARPALPARGAERAREVADDRLADLVAARADRGRDGDAQPRGARAERRRGVDGRLLRALGRAAPADVGQRQRAGLRIPEGDGQTVGREDRERHGALRGGQHVDGAGDAAAREAVRDVGAVDLARVGDAREIEAGGGERLARVGREG